ncbi:hypothetical protein FRB90_007610 [Tulasnella sp. 427]|nr:hypothetical protein FRB90_007610 [Tulasnella sp. 427]
MTSSSEEHSRYPPYSRRTASTDSGNVFSFAPPEPVLPRNGDYPSYIPATELDGETELDDDPINWSSHSRHLTTGPTATSISFPLTPRTPGPLTPYTPSSQPPQEPRRLASIQGRINPTPSTGESGGRFAFMPPTRGTTQSQDQRLSSLQNRIGPTPSTGDSADMMFAFMPPSRETIQSQEQRVDSIQGRSGPTPSTGESAGMMFTFLPPPQESAQSQPTTSSRLSSITELSALSTSRRNTTDSKDDPLGLLPETAAGNATKYFHTILTSLNPVNTTCDRNIYSASDLYAAAVPPESPVEVPSYTLSAPWIDEEEDSPYEEVRASVSNTDDPDIPCVTWRMWAVGLPLCALVGGFQMYAELRIPWPAIGYMVLLIWVYLAGKTLELLPIKSWDIGPFVFDLNPGPFSIKEHAAALVLASSSADPISVVPVARFIFGLETIFISGPPNMASQIVLILACPIIGISVAGNPLLIPWWATAHWFAGFVLFFWIVTPILYYLNVWKTGHLPMMDLSLYDRFAEPYDIARIIDPSVIRLNVTAYMEYSQPYLTVANTVSNLISYTTPTLLIVHTALYYGSSIIRWLRSHRDVEPDDIHAKLMRTYPDTPTWWYLTSLAVSFPLVLIVLAV